MRIGKGIIYIPQFMIILKIIGDNKTINQTQITKILSGTQSSVQRTLVCFIDKDWIKRKNEGRCVYYTLSDTGYILYKKIGDLFNIMNINVDIELDKTKKELEDKVNGKGNKTIQLGYGTSA